MSGGVPVLVTYDVHVHSIYPASDVQRYIEHTLDEHERTGMKASFLVPAEAARLMKPTVRAILKLGHQVGCHGLTHRDETYNSIPPAVQEDMLRRATREMEDIIQQRVTFFRAPVFKISGATIRILEELGYEADLSMNSQRLGVFSSDVWNWTWLVAPRRPYHPHHRFPWQKGKSKIWEIPLSCVAVPFMVNTGQVFGPEFMKTFFWALYGESWYRNKPIVYMGHPEDLCAWRRPPKRVPFRWRDLVPSRADGFRFKYALYETDPGKITRDCRSLLDYMRSFPNVRFLTVPQYVAELSRSAPSHRP